MWSQKWVLLSSPHPASLPEFHWRGKVVRHQYDPWHWPTCRQSCHTEQQNEIKQSYHRDKLEGDRYTCYKVLTVSDSQNVITPLSGKIFHYIVPAPSDIVICTLQYTYNCMYSYRHGLSFTLKSWTEPLSCIIVLKWVSSSTHRWSTLKIVNNDNF